MNLLLVLECLRCLLWVRFAPSRSGKDSKGGSKDGGLPPAPPPGRDWDAHGETGGGDDAPGGGRKPPTPPKPPPPPPSKAEGIAPRRTPASPWPSRGTASAKHPAVKKKPPPPVKTPPVPAPTTGTTSKAAGGPKKRPAPPPSAASEKKPKEAQGKAAGPSCEVEDSEDESWGWWGSKAWSSWWKGWS